MQKTVLDKINLTELQYAVYSCLCYFDIFDYPLQPQQAFEFVNIKTFPSQVNLTLNQLIELKLISETNGFYYLEKENRVCVNKRSDSENYFLKKTKIIKRYANLISQFPFVEAVCISGSCSKKLLTKEGDVDYFIITKPNRLWLCRTLLIAFKKIFLLNSRKYFCINYLVDSNHLEIPDKNIFVATEIKTLIPINNVNTFEAFLLANNWTHKFLPNKTKYNTALLNKAFKPNLFRRAIEFLLSGKLGDKFDEFCFKLTLTSWQKKFPNFSKEDFDLNLRSRKTVSKHHPRGFQKKVLEELDNRLSNMAVTQD